MKRRKVKRKSQVRVPYFYCMSACRSVGAARVLCPYAQLLERSIIHALPYPLVCPLATLAHLAAGPNEHSMVDVEAIASGIVSYTTIARYEK